MLATVCCDIRRLLVGRSAHVGRPRRFTVNDEFLFFLGKKWSKDCQRKEGNDALMVFNNDGDVCVT